MTSSSQARKSSDDKPIQYIINIPSADQVDLPRKMAVVHGQVYYQSTGENSGLPGIWLPCLGVKGTVPLDINLSSEKFNRSAVLGLLVEPAVWIIKRTSKNIAESNESTWCSFSMTEKARMPAEKSDEMNNVETEEKEEKEEKNTESNKLNIIFDRLYLKSDLVISIRLSDPAQWGCDLNEIYALAGLDKEQIALAKIPLILEGAAPIEISDPDKTNEWLIKHGATYPKSIFCPFPASYTKIWDNTAGPGYQQRLDSYKNSRYVSDHERGEILQRDTEYEQTRAILLDYVSNSAKVKRFFSSDKSRDHSKEVCEALSNKELHSAIGLATYVRAIFGDKLNPNDELAKRLRFIDQKIITDMSKAQLSFSYSKKWEKEKVNATVPVSPKK